TIRQMPEKPLYLIYAAMKNKNSREFLGHFADLTQNVYFVPIEGEINAKPPENIQQEVSGLGLSTRLSPAALAALHTIATTQATPCRVLICGSLYMAGNVLRALKMAPQ